MAGRVRLPIDNGRSRRKNDRISPRHSTEFPNRAPGTNVDIRPYEIRIVYLI